jgi:hypothetical protein
VIGQVLDGFVLVLDIILNAQTKPVAQRVGNVMMLVLATVVVAAR